MLTLVLGVSAEAVLSPDRRSSSLTLTPWTNPDDGDELFNGDDIADLLPLPNPPRVGFLLPGAKEEFCNIDAFLPVPTVFRNLLGTRH